MEDIFNLYKKMVLIHIGTKTTDIVFHKASEGFYELLFDIFHQISEKNQDLDIDTPIGCEEASQSAMTILEEVQKDLDSMIKKDNSLGMDNLLRGLYDRLESEIGTAKALLQEEQE